MSGRRYGVWAGNPEGWPENTERCIEEVWHAFQSYQCERKRGKGPEGLYCAQHAKKIEARIARERQGETK